MSTLVQLPNAAWYRHKKILITGAAGYLGAALAQTLIAQGAEVTLVDQQRVSLTGKAIWVITDITKPQVWLKYLAGTEVVFHLAALEKRGAAYDTREE